MATKVIPPRRGQNPLQFGSLLEFGKSTGLTRRVSSAELERRFPAQFDRKSLTEVEKKNQISLIMENVQYAYFYVPKDQWMLAMTDLLKKQFKL